MQSALRERTDETETPRVAILMGSDSDWARLRPAADALAEFGVPFEVHVASAHRSPDRLEGYVRSAEERGVRVLIAGAGLAAALPGAAAARTILPVIGVPLAGGALNGIDALYSIVQMPAGVPVATVGIDAARNAGLLAVQILAVADSSLRRALRAQRRRMADEVAARDVRLQRELGRAAPASVEGSGGPSAGDERAPGAGRG